MPPSDRGYEFVIVGAGSAGCVLANRLSADPSTRVLLLEAGGRDWHPLLKIPLGSAALVKDPRFSWDFRNEDEPALPGRRLSIPRGKVLGGTSSLNSQLYVRGNGRDYDDWAAAGNDGWSYAEALPYFKRSERFSEGAGPYHGTDGPLCVRVMNSPNPLYQAFIDAGLQMGFRSTHDFNGEMQDGFSRLQYNITPQGRRCSTAVAFLRPALSRQNLTVLTRAHATRVLLEGNRAMGVEYVRNGVVERASAGEIVLSTGAYQTPQLLMLSGIGGKESLSRAGIAPLHHLPGVGQNLQEHFGAIVQHECRQPITLYSASRPLNIAWGLYRAWFHGTGPLSHFPFDAQAFLKSDPSLDRPDLQFYLGPFTMSRTMRIGMMEGHGYCIYWCHLHPRSRGSVTLASANPLDPPRIRHNYLTDEADWTAQRRGFAFARALHGEAAFDAYRGRELDPGEGCIASDAIDAYLRDFSQAHYHPVGTAAMGQGDGAVVDAQLKVHGLRGLRVADASIMPRIVGGNTNAPTIMIAEKASDLVLGKEPPARESPPAASKSLETRLETAVAGRVDGKFEPCRPKTSTTGEMVNETVSGITGSDLHHRAGYRMGRRGRGQIGVQT